MKEQPKSISTLHDLLDHDIYRFISAEIHLKNKLPEWIHKANTIKLKGVLQRYLEFVAMNVTMLEQFFDQEKMNALQMKNRVMEAFILEVEDKMDRCSDLEVRDACLLECIQAINHFKISAYGSNAAFANALGMESQAALFFQAEVREKQIDDRLSQLAENEVNKIARAPIVLP